MTSFDGCLIFPNCVSQNVTHRPSIRVNIYPVTPTECISRMQKPKTTSRGTQLQSLRLNCRETSCNQRTPTCTFPHFHPLSCLGENSRPPIAQSDCCYVNQCVKILKSCEIALLLLSATQLNGWMVGWVALFRSITGVSK